MRCARRGKTRTLGDMNARIALAAASIAVALFLIASLLLFHSETSRQIIGALYVVSGATVSVCSKALRAQDISPNWLEVLGPVLRVRPTTFVLWGTGIAVFGALLAGGLI
jgi:hypothetical protein